MASPDCNLNILFLGGGSIGAIYAYLLSQHSCTITVAVRSSFPIVSSSGYIIDSKLFGTHAYRPDRVISSGAELLESEVFDYIFITTKATGSTLPLAGYPVAASTSLVLIQNGIGVEQPYADAFPQNTIISGVAYIAASQPEPGKIVQSTNTMALQLGLFPAAPPSSSAALSSLLPLLNKARIPTTASPQIQDRRWSKLLFNGCFATVCAATGLQTLAARNSPMGRELIEALCHEIRETAVASGSHMSYEDVEKFFERARGIDIVPSMLQDARKGVEMEVEVLCGNVWRIAEKFGVQTPRIRTMYAVLKGMNERMAAEREGRSQKNGSSFVPAGAVQFLTEGPDP